MAEMAKLSVEIEDQYEIWRSIWNIYNYLGRKTSRKPLNYWASHIGNLHYLVTRFAEPLKGEKPIQLQLSLKTWGMVLWTVFSILWVWKWCTRNLPRNPRIFPSQMEQDEREPASSAICFTLMSTKPNEPIGYIQFISEEEARRTIT